MQAKPLNISHLIISIITSAYFIFYAVTYKEWHFIDNVNLIIHEAGHTFLMFFGEFVNILGGSLFQILIPSLFAFYFYFKREFFSASLLLFWLGQNFLNISVYASDSVAMQLPLLGGDGVIHDWNYLLSVTGLLKYTPIIGNSIFALGIIVIFLAIYFSFCFSLHQSEEL